VSIARLTPLPGTSVAGPRLAESPAALERRRHARPEIGYSRQIIPGQMLRLHLRADASNRENLHVDPAIIAAAGRWAGIVMH
jgi:flavin reductase (DIM6/NTAB) family NADH-FMN oxidoreductase RutF